MQPGAAELCLSQLEQPSLFSPCLETPCPRLSLEPPNSLSFSLKSRAPSVFWILELRLTTWSCIIFRSRAAEFSSSQSRATKLPPSQPGTAGIPSFQPGAVEFPSV